MNNFFQENLKTIIIFSILYIVVVIVILALIWSPGKKPAEISKYSSVSQSTADNIAIKKYMDEIIEGYQLKDVSFLCTKMEKSYLEYIGQTPEDFRKKIKQLDTENIKVVSVKKYFRNNAVIYSVDVSFGTDIEKINLIEEYPGSYVYSLGTFYKYQYNSKNNPIEGIGFFIKSIYQDINFISIDLEIYNNNDKATTVKMESPLDVVLILENGESVSMTNTSIAKDDQTIKSGSKLSKKMVFDMPIELQGKVKNIKFNRVNIDGAEQKINFKIEL